MKALIEWQMAQDILLEAATFPFHMEGEVLPSSIPGKESRAYRKPVGVVGVISPWNFPLHLTGVFAGDLARGVRVAQQIEAGMTHVNDSPVHDESTGPFGGEKKSGLGRFGGAWAMQEFTTEHWITVQRAPRPYPMSARQVEEAAPAHVGGP